MNSVAQITLLCFLGACLFFIWVNRPIGVLNIFVSIFSVTLWSICFLPFVLFFAALLKGVLGLFINIDLAISYSFCLFLVMCFYVFNIDKNFMKKNNNEKDARDGRSASDEGMQSKSKKTKQSTFSIKIFTCPKCSQKIRVRIPPPSTLGTCQSCKANYRLKAGADDSLYIYLIEKEKQSNTNNSNTAHKPVSDLKTCFEILKVKPNASPQAITKAYKKQISQYHPDKVASLGEEFMVIAEQKTKEISQAYSFLKEKGLVK